MMREKDDREDKTRRKGRDDRRTDSRFANDDVQGESSLSRSIGARFSCEAIRRGLNGILSLPAAG